MSLVTKTISKIRFSVKILF